MNGIDRAHPLPRVALRLALSAAVLAALIAGSATAAIAAPGPVATAVSEIDQVRSRILADTNSARAAAGLAPLVESADIDGVAQGCSQQQAAADVMAHCSGFASRYPSGWTWGGENVAAGYGVDAVVTAWMNSQGHRDNILRADATHIGIGFARAADGTTYFTQNFASYPGRVSGSCTGANGAGGSSPVFRFWSPVYRGHFYTISADECRQVVANMPGLWRYEGSAFTAFAGQASGTVPLYRFYSRTLHGHFYTVSQAERDQVIATMPNLWSYEGVAYNVYPPGSSQSSSAGVYRFWSPSAKHHFYTASAAERDQVIATLSGLWTYESEAFRVPTN